MPALVLWVVRPDHDGTGYALIAAGLVQSFRLARWAGDRTVGESLVFILHVGYAFVPFGFLLLGASVFGFGPSSTGVHAWAGAVAVMTLAVMTRATRGHTGQALTADSATQAIYSAAVLSALARVIAAAVPASAEILLPVAGLAWTAAFLGFAVTYAPALCLATPRRASA